MCQKYGKNKFDRFFVIIIPIHNKDREIKKCIKMPPTLYIMVLLCYDNLVKRGGKDMNLDDLKKLSEIFNNFAQPIATLIVGYIGSKYVSKKSSKKRKKK